MPSQPEAQGDILKEFREGTFLSSLDMKPHHSGRPPAVARPAVASATATYAPAVIADSRSVRAASNMSRNRDTSERENWPRT